MQSVGCFWVVVFLTNIPLQGMKIYRFRTHNFSSALEAEISRFRNESHKVRSFSASATAPKKQAHKSGQGIFEGCTLKACLATQKKKKKETKWFTQFQSLQTQDYILSATDLYCISKQINSLLRALRNHRLFVIITSPPKILLIAFDQVGISYSGRKKKIV